MRISNKFITSIPCYRRHFDFKCIWSQLDVFVRDMSPEIVFYPDDKSRKLYAIIADPSSYDRSASDINKSLFTINDQSILDSEELMAEKFEDRVRIVALFELAEAEFDVQAYSKDILLSPGSHDIVLSHGQSLKIDESESETRGLQVRQIRVDSNSSSFCTVGGYELAPGGVAYGVFEENKLRHVIEPVCYNKAYKIYLSFTDGTAKTIIESRDGYYVRHLDGVVSFCTIGQDDYAYIANGKVYCGNDPHLAKELSGLISIFETPIVVQSDGVKLYITLADGTKKSVNHKHTQK